MRSVLASLGVVVVASTLAACSFQGAPVASEDPGNDQPDASPSAVDAAVVDPDPDNDGIENEADNCPDTRNEGQENEDGDDRGNACDVCPHLIDDGNDGDNDGVGDACDPQPDAANSWLVFIGFDTPLVASEWEGSEAFTVENGNLLQSDNQARHYLRYLGLARSDKLEVGASTSWSNPADDVAPIFRYGGPFLRSSARDVNNACWIHSNVNTGFAGFVLFVETAVQFNAAAAEPLPIVDNQIYRASISVDGPDHECRFGDNDNQPISTLSASTGVNMNGDRIGLVTSFTEASIAYFYAISLQ